LAERGPHGCGGQIGIALTRARAFEALGQRATQVSERNSQARSYAVGAAAHVHAELRSDTFKERLR
jgi:hypothetical protein